MKNKRKIIDNWIKRNGAANFDLKNRDIILYDGGLFSIEKEIKIETKTRMITDKEPHEEIINGKKRKVYGCKFVPIKRKEKLVKEKVEDYKAFLWFEELDETINYLKRMKSMLNKLGYNTKGVYKEDLLK